MKALPLEIRKDAGQTLLRLQHGEVLSMPLSRSIPSVGPGVSELRIRGKNMTYRFFYYTKSLRGILVFHAFAKKSSKTLKREIELGRKRLKEMLNETEEKGTRGQNPD